MNELRKPATEKPAILIVEDEKIIAIDLQIRLQAMDYEVVACVSTGQEALHTVLNHRVSIVLMDIMIDGDMDGIEAAALIHRHADVPIIFLTAYADENTFSRSSNSEPYAYILKPFQERELDLTIRTVLQKHSLEKRLRQSEARYRTLFEQTREAILILDSKAAIIEANTAAQALLEMRGISKADTLHDFFPEAGRHMFSIKWAMLLAGEGIKGRFSFTTEARQTKVIEYKIQGDFMPGMHIAVLSNITAGVAARRKIETLARFPAEAPNPILRISTQGDILYCNAAGTELVNDWKPLYGNRISDTLRKRLAEIGPKNRQLRSTVKSESKIFSLLFVYIPKSNYINIYATDITRQKAGERVTGFQKDVMEMIAKGNPLKSVLEQLVKRLEHFIPGSCCTVFVTEPESKRMAASCADSVMPEIADRLVTYFNSPNRTARPLPEMSVLISDTSDSEEGRLLAESGFRTLWVSPVWNNPTDHPAVFCVFFNRQHNPSPMEVSLVNIACKVTALALERELSMLSLFKQALVFENINDAVILTDSMGMVTQWNPSAQKLFGYSSREMLGRNIIEAGLFERGNRVEKLLRLVKGNADTVSPKWTDEFNFRTRHGDTGIAEVSFIKLSDGNRAEEAGTLVVLRDVTLRKRVEIALSTSEANLIALIENTEDIIFSLNKELCLVTFNSGFARFVKNLFGTKISAGMHIRQAISDDSVYTAISENFGEAMVGSPLRRETRFDLKGKPLDLEINVNPIFTEEGRLNGISLFARDITLRKEAENELKRTNFELDSFVYRASHDLRAPLRSVLGLVNILGFETNEEAKKTYLSLIEKSVNKLDNFISDLTNFSRNSRMEVKAEPVDLKTIVDDCMENLRYMENANTVQLNFYADCPGSFNSDPARISIVMQNLLSNAIKYRRNGTALVAFDAWVNVSIACNLTAATIVVEDNGKGIDPQYLERVFEMFFRASEDSYGSGLGLYITRQVVEKLKGTIEINSSPGRGTKFTIVLPNMAPKEDLPA